MSTRKPAKKARISIDSKTPSKIIKGTKSPATPKIKTPKSTPKSTSKSPKTPTKSPKKPIPKNESETQFLDRIIGGFEFSEEDTDEEKKQREKIELESPTKVYSKSKLPDNMLKAYLVSPLLKKDNVNKETSESESEEIHKKKKRKSINKTQKKQSEKYKESTKKTPKRKIEIDSEFEVNEKVKSNKKKLSKISNLPPELQEQKKFYENIDAGFKLAEDNTIEPRIVLEEKIPSLLDDLNMEGSTVKESKTEEITLRDSADEISAPSIADVLQGNVIPLYIKIDDIEYAVE